MKKCTERLISILLAMALIFPMLSQIIPRISAASYSGYTTLARIYDQSDCPSMQGFAVYDDYLYSAKVNTTTETSAVIARTHRTSGSTVYLTNSATGTKFFTNLGHANDLAGITVVGVSTLFVTTAQKGSNAVVRYVLNGSTAVKVASYGFTYNGTEIGFGGIDVVHTDSENIVLLLKSGTGFYTGTVGVNQTSGTIAVKKLFNINITDVTINGQSKDLTDFLNQGFAYHDHRIYVPMTGNTAGDISTIVVYDIQGASGTIKNDPDTSIWIQSTSYSALFEIESCGISPIDGKLYFNTNRRVTSSDTNHDGVHCLSDFLWQPDKRTAEPNNYRFETVDDRLVSLTTNGCTFNSVAMHAGSIADGIYSGIRTCLAKTIRLEHNRPWVLEWKSSGTWNSSMLLTTQATDAYVNAPYLYRRAGNSIIALGCYTGSYYTNYGIDISKHGIDGSAEHTYRLDNRPASDGSNMVYLSIDGKELGAMNTYFIGGTSQGTTSNWVSGKDFCFSYMGTPVYPVDNCSLDYLQVWYDGIASEYDEPNIYRWEDNGTGLATVSQPGITVNDISMIAGSYESGAYSGAELKLNEEVVLLHNRPWSVEWQTEGQWSSGSLLFASHNRSHNEDAAYFYRRNDCSLFAFGEVVDGEYHNYGISPADYGVDDTVSHVYRLTNRINTDGSNMVYLCVDGKEIGALNQFYIVGTSQNKVSDWISGKDFTFGYMGTSQHPLSGTKFKYVQVWENGVPHDDIPDHYRWELNDDQFVNVNQDEFSANPPTKLSGSIAGGVFADSYYLLEKNIVLRHDHPWSVEWASKGTWMDEANGALLLTSSQNGSADQVVYLYRRSESEIIAFGVRSDGQHHNYGVHLSNHGIDGTVKHRYQLINRIASDGSNMVYLFVDGVEIGAMNEYYIGGNSQNSTSDWINGKDFVFSYIGARNYSVGNCSVDYLQISEGDTPTGVVEFRNWDGSVVSSEEYSYGAAINVPSDPSRPADLTYTYTFTGWDKPVGVCFGDAVYTACYTPSYINYTVTFRDWNGNTLATGEYHYGDTVIVPSDPYRAEDADYTYQFKGWDQNVTNCLGNTVYTAVYTSTSKKLPVISPKYPSISFEDEILMNVYYTVSDLGDVSVEDMGLLVWSSPQTLGTIVTAEQVSNGASYSADTGLYCVHTQGISAKKLSDTIYFKVYIRLANGNYVYSSMFNYSPKTYASTVLSGSYSTEMKALVVAMLNYGAQAQIYFNYRPYNLMNADLTATQKAMVKQYSASMVSGVVNPSAGKLGDFTATTYGFTKKYPTVSFEGAFCINYYFTPSKTPVGSLKLYYWDADTYNTVSQLTTSNATGILSMSGSGVGEYHTVVEGIAAKDLDRTVYVAVVYSDGSATYCSGVLAYSIGTYSVIQANSGSQTMRSFAAATAVYGYYAKQYFSTNS